jgi:ABC-type transporter Mla subunit MlaD
LTTINPVTNLATDQSTAAAGYVSGAVTTPVVFTAAAAGDLVTIETGVGDTLSAAGVSSVSVDVVGDTSAFDQAQAATDAAAEATDAANAATDAANAAAEAADAATAAAQDAADAVAALSAQVATLISGLKAQLTALTNLVIKIQKKVKA